MLVAALDRNLLFSGYDACDRANSMSASLPWQHISPRASTYLSATADPHPQWHAQPPPPQPPSSSSWNTLDTQYSSFYSPPAPPIPHPSASTSPAPLRIPRVLPAYRPLGLTLPIARLPLRAHLSAAQSQPAPHPQPAPPPVALPPAHRPALHPPRR
ncbi:hypothetical protein EWM64_g2628 [Hericium alpestre]|uniref:Uncharacterized protein n=1 Tax=Hericium alpestre TaxID=135208 RepID=A0A4Z0A4Y5_9AGAM|nr:hypothetical protein EWM64_g2628 [Hericium alpestre]